MAVGCIRPVGQLMVCKHLGKDQSSQDVQSIPHLGDPNGRVDSCSFQRPQSPTSYPDSSVSTTFFHCWVEEPSLAHDRFLPFLLLLALGMVYSSLPGVCFRRKDQTKGCGCESCQGSIRQRSLSVDHMVDGSMRGGEKQEDPGGGLGSSIQRRGQTLTLSICATLGKFILRGLPPHVIYINAFYLIILNC